MRNQHTAKHPMSWLFGGLVLLLSTTGFTADNQPLVSELLEEGVYQEEARGDLDAAIMLYQQVVDSELVGRPKAAEAQYRLAVCYQKQGKITQSLEAFEALVRNYPNQTEWVDAALKYLPKPFQPDYVPWVDGETTVMEFRLPTGMVVGYSFYRTELIDWEGRELWRVTNRTLANMEMITQVEFDPVTMEPVYGYFLGMDQGAGEVSWWFEDGEIKSFYGDNPEEKLTPVTGPVIDNLQAHFLPRQFPIEVGFSTDKMIFVGMSGTVIPVSFTIVAIEEVETPMGVFECTKTEIDLGVQKQYFWTSTDDARHLIKFQAGGVEVVAVRSDVVAPGDMQIYRNENPVFSFEAPAKIGIFENPQHRENPDRARLEIREADLQATYSLSVSLRPDEDKPTDLTPAEQLREMADNQIAQYEKRAEGVEVDDASWRDFQTEAGAALSFTAHLQGGGQDAVVKKTFIRTDGAQAVFTMRCPAGELDQSEPLLEELVDSFRF